MGHRLRNFEDAYRYLRDHHGTNEASAPYCEDCAMLAPCPVEIVLNDHDRLARNLDAATTEIARLRVVQTAQAVPHA